jgi:hypothetical protein
VLWLRNHAVLVVAVLGTAALMTLTVLAMTGSLLSRANEITGERGGTLTVVSLEGSLDLDPARINDVYGTMIARAVHRTPYAFRPDREGGPEPADRVVVLEAGRVVEQGSPAELRAAGGHYAQLEAESERLA